MTITIQEMETELQHRVTALPWHRWKFTVTSLETFYEMVKVSRTDPSCPTTFPIRAVFVTSIRI